MGKTPGILIAVTIFAIISAIFHFSSPNIADSDSFFYFGQADRQKTDGLLRVDFPWSQQSALKDLSVSLWYGFTTFLIPFTYLGHSSTVIKLAGALLTAATLSLYYWTLKREKLIYPLFWPLLFFFSAPNILFRFLMVRPQIVSVALSPLLLSFLIRGNAWGAFLTAFAISWFHLNLAWLPILIATVAALAIYIINRQWKNAGWPCLAVLVGVLVGWLLRPNPIGAIKLFYIQVFQQIFEKQGGLPLLFGTENYPLSSATLFTNFLPFLLIWLPAIALIFWLKIRKSPTLTPFNNLSALAFSSSILSIIFFLLSVAVARRAYDFWISFGILAIAALFTQTKAVSTRQLASWNQMATVALVGIFIFLVFFSSYKTSISLAGSGYPPDYLKNAAEWLVENSDPQSIVFNLHWTHSSPLFFWNRHNYYIGTLDPIFQYAHNPSLYWKFHYLSADEVTNKTCGASACTKEMLEHTREVLLRDFNAKYVILSVVQNPLVNYFLENDPGFEKKFQDQQAAIYLIKR